MNCKGDHTANDAANCEAFKKAIAMKENKKKSTKTTNMNNKQSSLRANLSYAEKVKATSKQKPRFKNENNRSVHK